jgi:hypothetical protein
MVPVLLALRGEGGVGRGLRRLSVAYPSAETDRGGGTGTAP